MTASSETVVEEAALEWFAGFRFEGYAEGELGGVATIRNCRMVREGRACWGSRLHAEGELDGEATRKPFLQVRSAVGHAVQKRPSHGFGDHRLEGLP
jgi:hypothetical protein